MAKQWYIYKDGQQRGPLAWEKLTEMALAGEITPDDMVISEGMNEWISGSKIEGLFQKPVFVPPPPSPQYTTIPTPGSPASAPTPAAMTGAPVTRKKKSGLKIAAIVGASVIGLIILLIIVALSAARSALRSSEVYSQAMSALTSNQQAVQFLGEPISAGKAVNGEISISNGSGQAVLSIPVSGPQNKGRLEVEAYKTANKWNMTFLQLAIDGGDSINLLEVVFRESEGFKTFHDPGYGFAINYPETWSYEKADNNTVIFREPQRGAEPVMDMTVVILVSRQAGGPYADLEEILEVVKGVYDNIGGEIIFEEIDVDDTKQFGNSDYPYFVLFAGYEGSGSDFIESVIVIQRDDDLFYQIILSALAERVEELELVSVEAIESFRFIDFQ